MDEGKDRFVKRHMRKYLLAGAAVLLPLSVTIYFLWLLFGLLDGWARKLILAITGFHIPGVGLVLTLLLLFFVGLFATNFVGRKVIGFWESLLFRIPLICVIYKTTKQIVEVVTGQDNRPFRRAALIEYPRKGIYTIAFVTGEIKFKEDNGSKDLVCVFVCTTPNPTTGFLVLVPREEVIYLSNSVEEGIQLVLSGGIVGSSKNGFQGIELSALNDRLDT